MAEGWMKYYAGEYAEVSSAGLENKGINRLAHHLMMESVIDIGKQTSNTLNEYKGEEFDFVILMAELPQDQLNLIHFTNRVDFFLDDPLKYMGDDERMVNSFKEIRNKLDDFCFMFVNNNIRKLIPDL
jgi:arsenate reductase